MEVYNCLGGNCILLPWLPGGITLPYT